MKKIYSLFVLLILLTGCVYDGYRLLYGDEWVAEHLTKNNSSDQSNDTSHSGATPIINIADNSDDQNDVTEDPSNDTIVPENTTTTTIRYTISFNANGGSGTMADITMTNGESKTLPLCSFTAPAGKKFSCWLASDNNYASYYSDCEVVKDLMSENGTIVTLSAQWLEQSQYSIFYYNTMNAANVNPTTFFESESVTLQNLSATGYDFVGWNDAITGKRITGWAAGERTSNITLGAEWTPHSYTVIYYGNGGAGQTEKQTVSYGETFALRENGFTWDGHIFKGWCRDSNCVSVDYFDGETVCNLTAKDGDIIELYAFWKDGVMCSSQDIIDNDYMFSSLSSTIIITDTTPDLYAIAQTLKNSNTDITLEMNECVGLLEIPDKVFKDCMCLKKIVLPNSIKKIGEASFKNCNALSDIDIPNSVTEISKDAFAGCYMLENFTLPYSITKCGSIFTMKLSADHSSEYYMFPDFDRLYPVNYTGSIEQWCNITFNGNLAEHNLFIEGEQISELIIPDTVTELKSYAFACCNIISVTIPKNIKKIGDWCFDRCMNLENVSLSEGIETIGGAAFNGTKLKNITIPSTVTKIGQGAFNVRKKSEFKITVYATTPPEYEGPMESGLDCSCIYVPSESLNSYKTADGWSAYADRIYAIQE